MFSVFTSKRCQSGRVEQVPKILFGTQTNGNSRSKNPIHLEEIYETRFIILVLMLLCSNIASAQELSRDSHQGKTL